MAPHKNSLETLTMIKHPMATRLIEVSSTWYRSHLTSHTIERVSFYQAIYERPTAAAAKARLLKSLRPSPNVSFVGGFPAEEMSLDIITLDSAKGASRLQGGTARGPNNPCGLLWRIWGGVGHIPRCVFPRMCSGSFSNCSRSDLICPQSVVSKSGFPSSMSARRTSVDTLPVSSVTRITF